MTRGYKPVVAIGEAQRKATDWGFMLIGIITEAKLSFDFIVKDEDRISIVRIRRLKYASYSIEDIMRSCSQEIKELRSLNIPDGLFRELWVRGPDRTWHRYGIMPEGIEVFKNTENNQGNNNACEVT
jgi:hypothetical protein